jgi:hypothetical protein
LRSFVHASMMPQFGGLRLRAASYSIKEDDKG